MNEQGKRCKIHWKRAVKKIQSKEIISQMCTFFFIAKKKLEESTVTPHISVNIGGRRDDLFKQE